MNFQRITLMVALVLLIIVLFFIGISISYAKPVVVGGGVAACPAYWNVDSKGRCVNVQNLGTCKPASGDKHLTMDFTTSSFASDCQKYRWAKGCGITWDAITDKNPPPCASA